jgi:hypothetical protein
MYAQKRFVWRNTAYLIRVNNFSGNIQARIERDEESVAGGASADIAENGLRVAVPALRAVKRLHLSLQLLNFILVLCL